MRMLMKFQRRGEQSDAQMENVLLKYKLPLFWIDQKYMSRSFYDWRVSKDIVDKCHWRKIQWLKDFPKYNTFYGNVDNLVSIRYTAHTVVI